MFQTPHPAAEAQAATWNAKNVGKQVFSINGSGYRSGKICGIKYKGHWIAWAMVHNKWPLNMIDHINGIRHDNRIENLREVCAEDNNLNLGLFSNNKSGFTGVYQNRLGKWVAQITYKNKNYYLGEHKSITAAVRARKEAEIKFGFHPNHGNRLSHELIQILTDDAIEAYLKRQTRQGQHYRPQALPG
jgi:hypothetical protein